VQTVRAGEGIAPAPGSHSAKRDRIDRSVEPGIAGGSQLVARRRFQARAVQPTVVREEEKTMAAKTKKTTTPVRENEPAAVKPNHVHGTTVGALSGELAGAIVGAVAGPPGVVAGMLIGAAAGALAGRALDEDAEREHQHEDALDESIGVTSGDLGAPNLKHPPAKRGAFSAASVGVAGQRDRTPVEGPISSADDE
jgi:uncharacterized protein YcfJ